MLTIACYTSKRRKSQRRSQNRRPGVNVSAMRTNPSHPYDQLTPDVIVAAVEKAGFRSDGRLLPLNSYENRVYQVGIEDAAPIIAKFYRPDRWSTPAILEEHAFAHELAAEEIPIVAPLRRDGESLFEYQGFRIALYPRQGGHWPELATRQDREWMGRFLGRIHVVGRRRAFTQRGRLTVKQFGAQARDFLLKHDFIPEHLLAAYESVSADLLERIEDHFAQAEGDVTRLRLHGDCHPGNILWTDRGPHFVDLDDCLMGPAIQDIWMLLSGTRAEMEEQLTHLLAGYAQFATFNFRELALIENLRALRIMHYAAWLARRWSDPAFPKAFPWFAETRYWEQHVLALREQLAAVDEHPLAIVD